VSRKPRPVGPAKPGAGSIAYVALSAKYEQLLAGKLDAPHSEEVREVVKKARATISRAKGQA